MKKKLIILMLCLTFLILKPADSASSSSSVVKEASAYSNYLKQNQEAGLKSYKQHLNRIFTQVYLRKIVDQIIKEISDRLQLDQKLNFDYFIKGLEKSKNEEENQKYVKGLKFYKFKELIKDSIETLNNSKDNNEFYKNLEILKKRVSNGVDTGILSDTIIHPIIDEIDLVLKKTLYFPRALTDKILGHLYGETIFKKISESNYSIATKDITNLQWLSDGSLIYNIGEFDLDGFEFEPGLQILNPLTDQRINIFQQWTVPNFKVLPYGSKIAVPWYQSTINIWVPKDNNYNLYQLIQIIQLEKNESSMEFAWSPDGTKVAVSQVFNTRPKEYSQVTIFDIKSGKPLLKFMSKAENNDIVDDGIIRKYVVPKYSIVPIEWPSEDMLVVRNKHKNKIKIFNAVDGSEIGDINLSPGEDLVWSTDGQKFAVTNGKSLKIFASNDIKQEQPIFTKNFDITLSSNLKWSKDDKFIAVIGCSNKLVYIVDTQTGKIVKEINDADDINWIKFNNNANILSVVITENPDRKMGIGKKIKLRMYEQVDIHKEN